MSVLKMRGIAFLLLNEAIPAEVVSSLHMHPAIAVGIVSLNV